ncbi:Uncharacterised protein [uncultured Flavonifractor sp.]|uniref:Uncharacterized protein n=1 Tax=Flintibacter hominis TaxID=2763048 RepID=A0A8J6JCF0_9FIRM|nr:MULTISPECIES: hypothetical protein [Eubacteriales]MBS5589876.1 hypothetical protein [Clostridiales bacterium]SCG91220.1 Uncharacterised protein [uncultured Clostridium sp.]SCI18192.1 Uncharacterised protein [uncultured Flavonifractor sp.]MBC5723573.1 hypothetical protein [Flintibacter hominis]MCH1978883.1 hypothetical protein [Lawsonibacter sp. OA9]
MKKSRRWTLAAGTAILAALCLGAGVVLAANGDQNDPLVTMSYLDETVIPEVVAKVEENTKVRQQELSTQLAAQIAKYQQEIEAAGGSAGSGSASYTLVTMTSGQTMALEVGCEVLLRVGSATVQSNTSPALIDISTGGTVNSGASLTKNHLYMSTIPDRTLKAAASDVKLLVRGGWSVS